MITPFFFHDFSDSVHFPGLSGPCTNLKLFGEQETGYFHEMYKKKLVKKGGKDLRQKERKTFFSTGIKVFRIETQLIAST